MATEHSRNDGSKAQYYVVILDRLQDRSGGLERAPESRIRGPLTSSAVGSGRTRTMNSRSPCSYSISLVRTGVSSSAESSACSGRGPDWQTLRALVSLRFRDACSFRITRHPSHRGGHRFICTSPVCQLTSGLKQIAQTSLQEQSCLSSRQRMENGTPWHSTASSYPPWSGTMKSTTKKCWLSSVH